jgi:pimeloyl-ACP methyl ester carboxylesterase
VSRFVLVPGAGGAAWLWHLVVPRLVDAGHEAVAVSLPADDPEAGLPQYVEAILAAAGGRDDVTLVAQSLGGFSAVPAAARGRVRRLVLVNAMIPLPGERATDWWEATGSEEARLDAARSGGYDTALTLDTYFLHDVPAEVAATGAEHQSPEADIAFEQPCPFLAWPAVPTTVLAGRDDRFFPLAFQQRVAGERVGVAVEAVPGGHLAALSAPDAMAARILALG